MKLSPGKLAGMKAVSNERGVIAAAAMDQRGSLQKSLAKEKGATVTDAMMEEFKILVSEVLTPHASAICLIRSGGFRRRSGGQRMRDCCWLMKKLDMTRRAQDDWEISSTYGRHAG